MCGVLVAGGRGYDAPMSSRTPHRAVFLVGALLAAPTAIVACEQAPSSNGGEEKAGEGAAEPAADSAQKVAEQIDEKVQEEVAKELSDEARFGKDMNKKGCEILTAELVGETFGVPAAELKQMKMMGCTYTWGKGDDVVEGRISMLRAHKSEKSAAGWFERATQSMTKEELAAQMEKVKAKVKERKEIDTKLKKNTADKLTDIATDMTPDEGIVYEDVAGIGDEARVNVGDGSIWIRIDNLTFNVAAFKGKAQPPPDIKLGGKPDDMIAAAMEASKTYMKETAPQRKEDGITLAKVVVGAIK